MRRRHESDCDCRRCCWWDRNRSSRRPADKPASTRASRPRPGCGRSRCWEPRPSGAGTARSAGNKDVSADETSGQSQRAHGFHHENREIPATAATALQRLAGALHAFLAAALIEEVLLDAERDGAQQVHGPGGPGWIQKLLHPALDLVAGIAMSSAQPRSGNSSSE